MNGFDDLLDVARENPKHIVLAEGEDERVVEAALNAFARGLGKFTLLGSPNIITSQLKTHGVTDTSLEIIEPATSALLETFAVEFQQRRQHKGVTLEQARVTMTDPVYFAQMMVRLGYAHGSVAGARYASADTVRSAIQVIGMHKDAQLVSSYCLMLPSGSGDGPKEVLILADCALMVEPDPEQLARIAMDSADSARTMLGVEPRVAMLSFSTKGSARHARVDKVRRATELVQAARPDLVVDGELQLDASIVPEVGERKAAGSTVAGRANVLIFPNLEAGNIGYKLAERIGKLTAIGPILQGLAKPANDLSRGCNAHDILGVIAVTIIQAENTHD